MKKLPYWAIPSTEPAVHDLESDTVLEQTAKMYAAFNNFISEYNSFAETINEQAEKFEKAETEAREDFECKVTKVVRTFMSEVNKTISVSIEEAIQRAVVEGVTVAEAYDAGAESLDLIITGGEQNG